jgi:hypothetical protein
VNPYVFVVGCPRSGTTLLQRILDAHPQLAVINETRWVDHWFTRPDNVTAEGFVTRALVTRVLDSPRFAQLGARREDVEDLLDGRPLSYPTFVARLFDVCGRSRGKARVGDKTPRYVRSLPTLHELFRQAKFVHLIRDGRATALSVVDWRKAAKLAENFPTWREHPLATATLWWEWQVRLGREAGASLDADLYFEVRYEALVTDCARELGPLCAFLDLHFDETMLRFHEGRRRGDRGLSAKRAWLPPTPGLRDWRTQMVAEDIELVDAVAGDLLDELGYPRGATSASARVVAAELRRAFVDELRARGRRLPAGW